MLRTLVVYRRTSSVQPDDARKPTAAPSATRWASAGPVLALAGGLLTSAAFRPAGLAVLGFSGMVAGTWALRRARGWRAGALVGFLYGVGLFGSLLVWSLRFGIPAYAALAGSQALFSAIPGALAGSASRGRLAWVTVTAGSWTLAEAARARWPLGGFEWGQLAQSAVDLPVRAAAAVIGSVGLSGLLVAVAAAVVVATERGRPSRRLAPLAVVATLLAGMTGLGLLPWTAPSGTLEVAIVQVDPPCPGRTAVDCPGEQEANLEQFIRSSATLPDSVDLLLWGEGALSGRSPADAGQEVVDRMGALPAPLLAGVTSPTGPDGFFNRNVLYDLQGRMLDSYTKRHAVPFGEYVPARNVLGGIGDVGRLVPRDMVRGTEPGRLAASSGPVGTVSSWELSFSRDVRDAAAGSHAVVTLTTQATYERAQVSDQLLAIARLRAAELGKPMVIAATTGRSALLPAGGGDGPATRLFGSDRLIGSVTLTTGRTPFAVFGQALPVLLAVAVTGGAVLGSRDCEATTRLRGIRLHRPVRLRLATRSSAHRR